MGSKITNNQIAAILELNDNGYDRSQIAKYTSISKSQICRVINCARKFEESEDAARRWSIDNNTRGIYETMLAYFKPQKIEPVKPERKQISFDIPAAPRNQQEYNEQLRLLNAKLDVLIDIARAIKELWS